MLLPRYLPEPYIPRIIPLIWAYPSASDPPKLQIDSCLEVARRLRPCFGPRGLPKSVAFRFLHGLSASPVHTPDTASVLEHMGLEDPAARALASAAIAQAREVGDGSGLVILLGASLLEQVQVLLALGLTQQEVEEGYRLACHQALELLDRGGVLVQAHLEDLREERQVAGVLRVLLSTRVPQMADMLAEAVAHCCVQSWMRDKQGAMTFDPNTIKIIKTITPDEMSEELKKCPQEASDEEHREGRVDKKKEVTTTNRQQVQGERDEEPNKEEAKTEEEWAVCDWDTNEVKPNRNQENDEVGVYALATRVHDREQLLIDQFLSDYVGLRPTERVPSAQAHRCSKRMDQELEQDKDWEILSLNLEEMCLEGEEGVNGREGLGRWQTEEAEHHLLEKLRALGDGMMRRHETMRSMGGTAAAALRGSTAARKHLLIKGLLRFSRKYLVPRGRVQGPGKRQGQVGKLHGVQKRGPVRKPHRPMGKVRGPQSMGRKAQHPKMNSHISKQDPPPAIPLQASLGTDQKNQQGVTITLHSPDQELLECCEAAIGACLRHYGAMQSDPRLVSGAGAVEAVLSAQLCQYGLTLPGLEQMAVHSFAQALLAPVRVLGENRGTPADMATTQVHEALRRQRRSTQGPHESLDEDAGDLLESLECKRSALKKATTAVLSVMSDLRSESPGESGTKAKSLEFSSAPEPERQSVQQP